MGRLQHNPSFSFPLFGQGASCLAAAERFWAREDSQRHEVEPEPLSIPPQLQLSSYSTPVLNSRRCSSDLTPGTPGLSFLPPFPARGSRPLRAAPRSPLGGEFRLPLCFALMIRLP